MVIIMMISLSTQGKHREMCVIPTSKKAVLKSVTAGFVACSGVFKPVRGVTQMHLEATHEVSLVWGSHVV